MPQSPHRLRNDLKCVERDVKPYHVRQNVVFCCVIYVVNAQAYTGCKQLVLDESVHTWASKTDYYTSCCDRCLLSISAGTVELHEVNIKLN